MLRVGAALLTTGATTVVALFMIAAPLDGIAFAQPEGGEASPAAEAAKGLPRRSAPSRRAATASGYAAARSDASGATARRHAACSAPADASRATAADISSCAAAAHCATGRASTRRCSDRSPRRALPRLRARRRRALLRRRGPRRRTCNAPHRLRGQQAVRMSSGVPSRELSRGSIAHRNRREARASRAPTSASCSSLNAAPSSNKRPGSACNGCRRARRAGG